MRKLHRAEEPRQYDPRAKRVRRFAASTDHDQLGARAEVLLIARCLCVHVALVWPTA